MSFGAISQLFMSPNAEASVVVPWGFWFSRSSINFPNWYMFAPNIKHIALSLSRFFPFNAASTSDGYTGTDPAILMTTSTSFQICPCTFDMTCFDPVLLSQSICCFKQCLCKVVLWLEIKSLVSDCLKEWTWASSDYIFMYSGSAWILCLISSVYWLQITEYDVFIFSLRTSYFWCTHLLSFSSSSLWPL